MPNTRLDATLSACRRVARVPPALRHVALMIGLAVVALLGIACASDEGSGSDDPAGVPGTVIPAPTVHLEIDQARNDAINEAIRMATLGCPGVPDTLSGAPTRIMMAVTALVIAGPFVNPEAGFSFLPSGPGFSGGSSSSVWVMAIEGHSTSGAGAPEIPDGASGLRSDLRSFLFVLEPWNPIVTGCVIRDAPMPTSYWSMTYGGFEFDVLLETE